MLTTAPDTTQLDELLDLVCVRLQPTPSQYRDAEDKYVAVGRWLSASDSGLEDYSPEVYPQGSFRIGTPIRPITLEYDVDLVCEVRIDHRTTSAMAVYALVERRLSEHKVYRDLLERKNVSSSQLCWPVPSRHSPRVPKPGEGGNSHRGTGPGGPLVEDLQSKGVRRLVR